MQLLYNSFGGAHVVLVSIYVVFFEHICSCKTTYMGNMGTIKNNMRQTAHMLQKLHMLNYMRRPYELFMQFLISHMLFFEHVCSCIYTAYMQFSSTLMQFYVTYMLKNQNICNCIYVVIDSIHVTVGNVCVIFTTYMLKIMYAYMLKKLRMCI